MFPTILEFEMKLRSLLLSVAVVAGAAAIFIGLGGGSAPVRGVAAEAGSSANAQSARLITLLPESDGIMTVDVKRFFGSVPQVLGSNQTMLGKVMGKADEFKQKTGIDIRDLDSVAVGVTVKQEGIKKYDVSPVILARGKVSAAALIGAAKVAAKGDYREEKLGNSTLYIFSVRELAQKAQKKAPAQSATGVVASVAARVPVEMAVTALDNNTIAFGDVDRVRATVASSRRPVASELLTLLTGTRETAIVRFVGQVPAGLKEYLPLENDELGRNIEAVRIVYGFFDVAPDSAILNATMRTDTAGKATALYETLEGLRMAGSGILGGVSGERAVYGRMIDNLKVAKSNNNVNIDLTVPQSDIDLLVAKFR